MPLGRRYLPTISREVAGMLPALDGLRPPSDGASVVFEGSEARVIDVPWPRSPIASIGSSSSTPRLRGRGIARLAASAAEAVIAATATEFPSPRALADDAGESSSGLAAVGGSMRWLVLVARDDRLILSPGVVATLGPGLCSADRRFCAAGSPLFMFLDGAGA